jgi:hypothetical protein
VSEVGGSNRIGFIGTGYNHKIRDNGVKSSMDWIRVIELFDLRLYHVVILPHYGDTTDDGTPVGQNGCQYKSQPRRFSAMMEARIDANRKAVQE